MGITSSALESFEYRQKGQCFDGDTLLSREVGSLKL
jgi:hypothetical protein